MAAWKLLTNHGLVLGYIGYHPNSTGIEIARSVGITERAVRKIVGDLRDAGLVEPERIGRRNRYRIDVAQPVQLLGNRLVPLGELLTFLWTDSSTRVSIDDGEELVTGKA